MEQILRTTKEARQDFLNTNESRTTQINIEGELVITTSEVAQTKAKTLKMENLQVLVEYQPN